MNTISLEGLLPLEAIYKKYGIRKSSEFISPRFQDLINLRLPRGTVFHYGPLTSVEYGPNSHHPMVLKYEGDMFIEHVEDIKITTGSGRRTSGINTRGIINEYQKRNRMFRHVKRISSALRSDRALLVVNYAFIPHLYKYQTSALADYYSWYNLRCAMYEGVNKYLKLAARTQVIEIRIPPVIPTLAEFKRLEKPMSTETYKKFNSRAALNLADLWIYINKYAADTPLRKLNDEASNNIHLYFVEGAKWTMVSLALLKEWQADNPEQFEHKLLRFFEVIRETNTSVTLDAVEKEELAKLSIEEDTATPTTTLTTNIANKANDLARSGALSTPEVNRIIKLSNSYKKVKNPVGEGTLEDLITILPAETNNVPDGAIPDISTIEDKSMLNSTITGLDNEYISKIYEKDIAGAIMSFQNGGLAITDYQKENTRDAISDYDIYTVKVTPITGKSSTLRIPIPRVRPDGTFVVNGVNYRMVKQRSDAPIHKVRPSRVALTSCWCKTFVDRSERAVNNYTQWVVKNMQIVSIEKPENSSVSNVKFGKAVVIDFKCPRTYHALTTRVVGFVAGGITYTFKPSLREKIFGAAVLKKYEKDGAVVCGVGKAGVVTIDNTETFTLHGATGIKLLGTLEDICGYTFTKQPVQCSEVLIFNKPIPVGIALSWKVGLTTMIRRLHLKCRWLPKSTGMDIKDTEIAIPFANEVMVFDKSDKLTELILGGFYKYRKTVKRFESGAFDKKDIYMNVLSDNNIGPHVLRELELQYDVFVDPITLGELTKRKLPEDYYGLLVEACKLLTTDDHVSESDPDFMRLRGYERVSSFIYIEMVNALREYRNQLNPKRASVGLRPSAVWETFTTDATIQPVDVSNPIQNLREKELVTFSGEGGRSAVSMVKSSRKFDRKDLGLMSDAFPDSQKVGITAYTTANPKLDSLRGTSLRYDGATDGPANVLSTTALATPCTDRDSPQRVNFISIQNQHTVSCPSYTAMPLRTGYELVIAHRADESFAYNAPDDGKVLDVSETRLLIEVGTTKENYAIELGRIHGKSAGVTLPHDIVTDLSAGHKFKKGDILSWDSGYFERDFMEPTQVNWLNGRLCNAAIIENSVTLEDSCAPMKHLVKDLGTSKTEVRVIGVEFKDTIHGLLAKGDITTAESILCTIEDDISASTGLFDEGVSNKLNVLAANTPRAKIGGVIDKIEVIYNGELEDMSDSLLEITKRSDRIKAKRAKELDKGDFPSGRIYKAAHVDGTYVNYDTAIIKVYITKTIPAGAGDKFVLSNSLKTVAGDVLEGECTMEDGTPIDILFSYMSISNRVVLSPEVSGTANMFLTVLSKHVSDMYFDD